LRKEHQTSTIPAVRVADPQRLLRQRRGSQVGPGMHSSGDICTRGLAAWENLAILQDDDVHGGERGKGQHMSTGHVANSGNGIART
jgi:hypothetical protein